MSDDGCRKGEEERKGPPGTTYEENLSANGGIVTLEVIFEILTSRRRRFILYYLRDHEIVSVEELARQIVAWEENIAADTVDADDRDRLAAQLVHLHLPKLAEAVFIEYDSRSDTIRYTDPPELLDTVLGLLAQLERESTE